MTDPADQFNVVEVVRETKMWAKCPSCAGRAFGIDRPDLQEQASRNGKPWEGNWACGSCGTHLEIRWHEDGRVAVQATAERDRPIGVILRIPDVGQNGRHLYMMVRATEYGLHGKHQTRDTPEERAGHQAYFYNQHTCPTNWLRDVAAIWIAGDSDPHGIAEYVGELDCEVTNDDPNKRARYTDMFHAAVEALERDFIDVQSEPSRAMITLQAAYEITYDGPKVP